MAGRLEGKVAIITGATSGIGEATARVFATEGARLVLAGRSSDKGAALADELGEQVVFQRADVLKEADIAALVETATRKFGRLDCLFNNAGAPAPGTLESVTEQEFTYAMQLLVGSVLFGMKHASRVMKAQGGGSIINNASIASHRRLSPGHRACRAVPRERRGRVRQLPRPGRRWRPHLAVPRAAGVGRASARLSR